MSQVEASIPKHLDLLFPTLQALKALGVGAGNSSGHPEQAFRAT